MVVSRSQTKTGMRDTAPIDLKGIALHNWKTWNVTRHRYAMHFVMIDPHGGKLNGDKLDLLLSLISTLVSNGSIRLNQNAKMC